jgi:hypothetical protein
MDVDWRCRPPQRGHRALGRGFFRNDYYNGIDLAFLLNARAACANVPLDAIADFTWARRVCSEVLTICNQWVADNPTPPQGPSKAVEQYPACQYWVLPTLGEAKLGLDDPAAQQRTISIPPSPQVGWEIRRVSRLTSCYRCLQLRQPTI